MSANPGRLAALDQSTAAARDDALTLAKFYRTLRKHGVGKRLARELTIGYQESLQEEEEPCA